MSKAYSLSCKDCGVSLWIGQGWGPDSKHNHLYTGYEPFGENLLKFLWTHEKHRLIFHTDDLVSGEFKQLDVETGKEVGEPEDFEPDRLNKKREARDRKRQGDA